MAFASPKRKRAENLGSSPVTAPLLIPRFPQLPPDFQNIDGGSPRTEVAGQFQDLQISSREFDAAPDLDDRPRKKTHYDDEIMESSQESATKSPRTFQQVDGPDDHSQPYQPPTAEHFTFQRSMSSIFPNVETPRPKSPSLKGEVSDQYWHESEITGHDPDDPDDDGYGINGIGFKPTSAMAQARTLKRKHQIAEYRNREAKEARQKRSERRRVASTESKNTSPVPESPSKSKVRFREIG